MSDLILLNVAEIVAILLLILGIYQIAHPNKLVGKSKKSIYEPKAVGWMLVFLGFMCAFMCALFGDMKPETEEALSVQAIIGMIAIALSAIAIIAFGLVCLAKKRIIFFKNTSIMRKYNRKYQVINSIFCILTGLVVAVVFLVIPNIPVFYDPILDNPGLATIIALIPVIFAIPVIVIVGIIEHFARKEIKK